MKDFERILIPPIEPGVPFTVRKCAECKNKINLPDDLIGKLVECPFCHKPNYFRNRIKEAKQTVFGLGFFLVAFVVLLIISSLVTFLPPEDNIFTLIFGRFS